MEAPKRPPVGVRGGSEEVSSGCFVTCSPTERKGRNKSFGGDGCVVFVSSDFRKRVLKNDKFVHNDDDDDDDVDENNNFQ